ncbi:MAG: response regulator [Pseudomonadota bacterium]
MSAGSTSILIVDDEQGMRDLLRWTLAGRGHQVVEAACSSAALAEIQKAEFDLVIADVVMPGQSGIDLLGIIKETAPDTEVVMLTAYADTAKAIECLQKGAFDLIQKPFDTNELVVAVDRALERRQLRAATALLRTSQAIFAAREPQSLPKTIIEVAIQVMDADDVSLMLAEGDRDLYLACSHGLSPQVQTQTRLAFGERVAGRVAVIREPVIITDGLASDPRFADVPSNERVRSSIVYPLLAGERLVGVLSISRIANERPYRRQDLERAAVLASQVLLALENARLIRQIAVSERLVSMGQAAAWITHEINNPLSYMLMLCDTLDLRVTELAAEPGVKDEAELRRVIEEFRRDIGQARECTSRIHGIVRDARLLASGDAGLLLPVDLNDVVRSALRLSSVEILRARATVTPRLGTDTKVLGNAGRLCQVFLNLVVNAVQAASRSNQRPNAESIQVTVSTERQGDRILAQVLDSGSGIAPEHLSRIFEPFFTTKEPGSGTGLGLSISREIVRQHNGEIRVASILGRGTTFTVDLPSTPEN